MIRKDVFFGGTKSPWIYFFPPIPLSRPSKPAWVEPVKVPIVFCKIWVEFGHWNILLIPHFLLICECSGCKRMVFCQDWILLHQFQHCFVWMPDLNFPKNAWQLCGVLVPNGRFQAAEKEAWCAQSQVPGLDAQQKKKQRTLLDVARWPNQTHIFNFSWLVIFLVEIIMVFVAIIAMMAASPHRYRWKALLKEIVDTKLKVPFQSEKQNMVKDTLR